MSTLAEQLFVDPVYILVMELVLYPVQNHKFAASGSTLRGGVEVHTRMRLWMGAVREDTRDQIVRLWSVEAHLLRAHMCLSPTLII